MQKIDLTKLGGLFTYQDTLEFMQNGYYLPLRAFSIFSGEKYVIAGCVEAGNDVSDGWVVINGEIMPFVGGNFIANPRVIINTVQSDEGFDDGTLKTVYEVKTAGLGNTGGFDYTELKRVAYNSSSIGEFSGKVKKVLDSILQLEPEVILNGCEVSAITTGPDTMDVSAGLVLFDGILLESPAYSGPYPAYLKEDGGWVNIVPGAGLYITFDPHTSQRYINVLDRSLTPSGRIIMMETLSDRFDTGTGLGKWEMKGYQLMSEMQNRVPLGLWYDAIPEANVSDPLHAVEGNQGGEKLHQLTQAELPSIPGKGLVRTTGNDTVTAFDASPGEMDAKTMQAWPGTDTPHENRQPFTVIVYAKRS